MSAELVIGASYYCSHCHDRSTRAGPCRACGRVRSDVLQTEVTGARVPAREDPPRTALYVVFNLTVAVLAGWAAVRFARRIDTHHYVGPTTVKLIAFGLGALGGRLVAALVAMAFAAAAFVVRALVPDAREHASPPRCEFDALNGEPIDGVVRAGDDRASLPMGLEGVLVGARGRTRGVSLTDAIVAPFIVERPDGERVRVEIEVGMARVGATSASAFLGDAAPPAWGLPRRGQRLAPVGRVETWSIADGARVRVEGGQRDGTSVRGTAALPVVLDFTRDVAAG